MAKNIYAVSYQSRERLRKLIQFGLMYILVLIIVSNFIISQLFFPIVVKSVMMEPTIEKNNILMVSPLASVRRASDSGFSLLSLMPSLPLKRGDVVFLKPSSKLELTLFQKTLNVFIGFFTFQQFFPFSPTNVSQTESIRRVVGFPGDTIFMRDYILHIRPSDSAYYLTEFELSENKYDLQINKIPENWDIDNGFSGIMGIYTLAPDEYFVLADNRTHGSDSRIWGSIKDETIKGKALFRYFPFSKFTKL
ncbi:MAG: signal peptidase I [Treponemataceae bacterium]